MINKYCRRHAGRAQGSLPTRDITSHFSLVAQQKMTKARRQHVNQHFYHRNIHLSTRQTHTTLDLRSSKTSSTLSLHHLTISHPPPHSHHVKLQPKQQHHPPHRRQPMGRPSPRQPPPGRPPPATATEPQPSQQPLLPTLEFPQPMATKPRPRIHQLRLRPSTRPAKQHVPTTPTTIPAEHRIQPTSMVPTTTTTRPAQPFCPATATATSPRPRQSPDFQRERFRARRRARRAARSNGAVRNHQFAAAVDRRSQCRGAAARVPRAGREPCGGDLYGFEADGCCEGDVEGA